MFFARTTVDPALLTAPHKLPSRRFSTGADKSIMVPNMGDSITEGTIKGWLKKEGEYAALDEIVCEIETDKIVVEFRMPEGGVITKQLAAAGATVQVGSHFLSIAPGAAPAGSQAKAAAPAAAAPVKATSSAPTAVPPKQDAPKAVTQPAPVAPAQAKPPAGASANHASSGSRTETRVAMTRMRKRTAERLKDSQNTAASLTTFNEIDMSAIIQLRTDLKEEFEKKHGIKLGFMSAFVKAATAALQAQPVMNAVIDGNDVVYREYIDVSVAVASPAGLVVPVLRDTQHMSFADVEKGIAALGDKAKASKLALEDMAGGTFTITNGGVFGSMMGTAGLRLSALPPRLGARVHACRSV